MTNLKIKGVLMDVGGVIMTNGFDTDLREKIAKSFQFDWDECKPRHDLFFDILELGKIGFDEYLKQVIFFKKRPFTLQEIFNFVKEAVLPYPEMLSFFREIKKKYGLKIGIVSNENKDLAIDRFKKIPVHDFVDYFLVSSFVGMRKPNPDIYHLALNLIQYRPEEVIYIDDRELFTTFARTSLNIPVIHHVDRKTTEAEFLSIL